MNIKEYQDATAAMTAQMNENKKLFLEHLLKHTAPNFVRNIVRLPFEVTSVEENYSFYSIRYKVSLDDKSFDCTVYASLENLAPYDTETTD